ncbi:MAG: TetR/AcrR family transcriptional regulator [Candidatus Gallimonas sp.]
MARNKIGSEKLLQAAAEVVGSGKPLTARAVAERLNCSTQPVYSAFGSMEKLKRALTERAESLYRERIDAYRIESGRNAYEAYGMGYVKFAREEKGLFRFLYMREREGAGAVVDDVNLNEILADMGRLYGMDGETAKKFHGDMSVFSYGLAALVNTGYADLTDEEIGRRLKRQFYALYAYYFPDRPQIGSLTEREGEV